MGGAPGDADCGNLLMHLEAVVAGKSVSHYHCHSVWWGEDGGGVERCWDNGDGGVAYGDTGITEIDSATESIYLGDSGVDITSLYEIRTPSFPALGLTHSCGAFINPRNLCGSSLSLASLHRSTQFVWFLMAGSPCLLVQRFHLTVIM